MITKPHGITLVFNQCQCKKCKIMYYTSDRDVLLLSGVGAATLGSIVKLAFFQAVVRPLTMATTPGLAALNVATEVFAVL